MDIFYWIIILGLYLLAQWMKRRRRRVQTPPPRRPVPRGVKEEEEAPEPPFPDWLRQLGFAEMVEKEGTPEVEEREPEERIAPEPTLREQIESFDEWVTTGPEAGPELEPAIEKETELPRPISKEVTLEEAPLERRLDEFPGAEGLVRPIGLGFGESLYEIGSLRRLILIREILGLPRAVKPYRYFM